MNQRILRSAALCCGVFVSALGLQLGAQPAPAPAAAPKPTTQEVKLIPPVGDLAPADKAALEEAVQQLGKEIDSLKDTLKDKPRLLALLPDVQVYYNALRYPLVYRELIDPKTIKPVLADAMERAKQLREGKPAYLNQNGPRGYVSVIDGSVQPYNLVVPTNLVDGTPQTKPARLDIWCHGRNEKLTEMAFIRGKDGGPPAAGPDKFTVFLYGRFCNANKFAGEIDCLEAMADVKKRHAIDENRVLMMGFSMGGAAAWQFATHYTDLWAAASPGAGFSESKDFLKLEKTGEINTIPWYEKTLWHWYDDTDYAINTFNTPTVAYSGEIDGQKQAADMMAKAMEAEGLKLEHFIGPKTAHAYEKETKVKLHARLDEFLAKGRNTLPKEIRFTTWTLRYNRMFWVTVDGMEQHWARARVNAELGEKSIKLKTQNVSALTITLPMATSEGIASIEIDGATVRPTREPVSKSENAIRLTKVNGAWKSGAAESTGLAKRHGLQGPIDDAFMDSFLIVRPTGKAANEKVGAWTTAECDHAIENWRRQFRGEARVKTDDQVTDADIAAHNLVLFGDSSSNKILAKIAGQLPVKWDGKSITVGEQTLPADHHAVAMIYPNPLNPRKYVVLNSGFTFREFDYTNNARQTAKLPDWAVIDISNPPTPKSVGPVPAAGFFGEKWEWKKEQPK